MTKTVGLFFGSFNPIHSGHIRLANYIYRQISFDEIWYIVSPRNPLKSPKELIDETHRYHMLLLATQDYPYIKVSDIEFNLPKPSYTVNTLQLLRLKNPNTQFSLLIGSDNMQLFDQWRDHQTILQHHPILVYPRKGYETDLVKTKYPTMQLLTTAPTFDISSTEIRRRIAHHQSIRDWVDRRVCDYISQNKLYR